VIAFLYGNPHPLEPFSYSAAAASILRDARRLAADSVTVTFPSNDHDSHRGRDLFDG
jgi:hypothetical protein